jgi:hypothetical protein
LKRIPLGERWILSICTPYAQFVTLSSNRREIVIEVDILNWSVPCLWNEGAVNWCVAFAVTFVNCQSKVSKRYATSTSRLVCWPKLIAI